MFDDKNVKRWYDNNAQGSNITADVYLRRLGAFCKSHNTTPKAIVAKNADDLYDMMLEFVQQEQEKKRTGSYIHSTIKALKSWLTFNNITMVRKVKIKGATQRPTLENEQVPSQEELHNILMYTAPNYRIAAIIMAHSGVRPEVLGNYDGTDGLTIGDFPEMKIEGTVVNFEKIPTLIRVRSGLSKTGNNYLTFLSEEGCDYLKTYLESRMLAGEKLTAESDIIHPKSWSKRFVTSSNLSDGIRIAMRKAGITSRPYVLRSFFATQLLLAESRGKIPHSYSQFFMGHQGDMGARYSINKGRLPPELLDDLREAYHRCQPYLQTASKPSVDEDALRTAFRKQFLTLIGYSTEDIAEMDIVSMEDEEVQKLVQEKGYGKESEKQKQRVVSAKDLNDYLKEGYTYVTTLPDGKILIQS
jgi:integrase